jgi:predicted metal-dependent hydrolase
MKITLSKNFDNIGVAIEANKDEVGGVKKLKELAEKFQSEMTRAYEAAQMVFKQFPEFKQVTLDTMTDEERDIIEQAEISNNKN